MHHPAWFCRYKYFGSGDKMVLRCHVISQDHVVEGSSNFMGKSSAR